MTEARADLLSGSFAEHSYHKMFDLVCLFVPDHTEHAWCRDGKFCINLHLCQGLVEYAIIRGHHKSVAPVADERHPNTVINEAVYDVYMGNGNY